MQCSFAKQNTGHGTNAAKKVAAAPADTYRRSGKPPLQIIVLKTQLLAFRRPFLRKIASRCSTGSVPRRVERSGRRRPPCRSDRGRNPVRRQIGEKAALSRQSGCTCPAGKLLFRILPVPARQKTGLWNCAVHVSSLFSISVLQPCFQSFIIKEDS